MSTTTHTPTERRAALPGAARQGGRAMSGVCPVRNRWFGAGEDGAGAGTA